MHQQNVTFFSDLCFDESGRMTRNPQTLRISSKTQSCICFSYCLKIIPPKWSPWHVIPSFAFHVSPGKFVRRIEVKRPGWPSGVTRNVKWCVRETWFSNIPPTRCCACVEAQSCWNHNSPSASSVSKSNVSNTAGYPNDFRFHVSSGQ
jgi:hypothetical protein